MPGNPLQTGDPGDPTDQPLGPGQTLFTLVRHWSRRTSSTSDQRSTDAHGSSDHGRLVMTVEAVNSLVLQGIPATVNHVADEIGIDQSGASRLITAAVDAGHLTLQRSPTDGRRREAQLTSSGRALLEGAHRWQEEVFDELTANWSSGRRRDFHRAMADLIERSQELNQNPSRPRT